MKIASMTDANIKNVLSMTRSFRSNSSDVVFPSHCDIKKLYRLCPHLRLFNPDYGSLRATLPHGTVARAWRLGRRGIFRVMLRTRSKNGLRSASLETMNRIASNSYAGINSPLGIPDD